MDPNANIGEQVALAKKLKNGITCKRYSSLAHYEEAVNRLAELVIALDECLQGGGLLPAHWARPANKGEAPCSGS